MDEGFLERTRLLLGKETTERIGLTRVIIFGIGGVGSWCAESLVRSGIRRLTIVDGDRVCETNINRQLMATVKTVGQVKVEAMKEHLLMINPDAEIDARHETYTEKTVGNFNLDDYDYVIDAIDSVKDKILLIEMACRSHARLFSSMGAALKLDPTRIKVTEFWKVQGCPLARTLRQRFKKSKTFPSRKFLCVYSEELLENKKQDDANDTAISGDIKFDNKTDKASSGSNNTKPDKPKANGSLMHITAIFGLTIAGLVLQDIHRQL